MIPLSDGLRARTFPWVNVAIIVANLVVWVFVELPHLDAVTRDGAFYPCALTGSCHAPEPWPVSWFTAMFLHASWDHVLGNMLFLAVFGKNVEDAFGHLRYLGFYVAGGLAASLVQTAMTLLFGSTADGHVAVLGASGAIAAVLGAYFVMYPGSRVLTLVVVIPVWLPAWLYLGGWFVFQFVASNEGLFAAGGQGGTAFFAHVGGFVFGAAVARHLVHAERVTPAHAARPHARRVTTHA
jgi:membrane associated rhomboid family serine protease